MSAATYALAMLMARRMGAGTSASVMAFYQNGVYLVGALLIASFFHITGIQHANHKSIEFLIRPWIWPTMTDLLLVGSCGVIAAIGMTLLTHAYRIAKASVVTSFEYTGMLWAPLWGFAFFGEVPHITTLAGAALIVVAGLFALSSPAARDNQAHS
jgi:drug/metabolite transporter (DMT)-like permease